MMRYRHVAAALSLVLGLGLTVQAAAKPVVKKSNEVAQIVKSVVARMKSHTSVSAKITQDIDLLGYRFKGAGSYQRQGADHVRLDVSFTVRGTGEQLFEHSLLEVCDGKTWWRCEKMPGGIQYQKVDMTKVRKQMADLKLSAQVREAFLLQQFGFGGMFPLVEGLESFADLAVQRTNAKQWVLGGHVTPHMANLLGVGANGKLPKPIPQQCRLVIDRKTLWPMRVTLSSEADPAPEHKKPYVMTLAYSDVTFDKPIPAAAFAFTPPKKDVRFVRDITEGITRRLASVAQQEAQRKAREAARKAAQSAPASAPDASTAKPGADR